MPDPGRDQDPTVALQRVLATLSYLLTRSRAHERQAAEAGVTAARSDLWLLMALEDSGGISRVGDLAALLMVEPPHVTRQIGQLESQDLVERTPDSLDRRARKVAITPHGRAVLSRLQQTSHAGLHEALAGFDDTDIATTVAVLNHLVAYARRKHTDEERQRGRGM
ncbi:MarR family transcriptional regulator [Streptomyces platensis]|uniref:MarR family winged helix-turn-helix transcriptional regulator n=1 Tax=Streptomyces platensis TaxID=58346 RepID=UPI002E0E9090|nr:MarR family transcriptional regulator [Streptomyces platensis]WSI56419.1 MarR family transcriptional regulator [Streptomyces platensis]WTI53563.1 MarR family transcriptional regulator [Streptomyces platensis]WUB80831.1 MarR family transcriptional regulator [Streptomyces platensis]